ncbi:hypothetical protein [Thermosediminibacter litoriperuensis]|uniref:Nitrogen regulatory protein P-II n=1 Tax=Thermosediminibacter litoriperuensis TaxID=291989 RepID=A0A5S5AQ26_9FIRM|nr:hypothetical protein [Thermosediminibacter litoriperuensis]TYP53747.1 hypothetical protein LZ11_01469 [Thermosediminibacter litoriperuensis]
MRITAVIPRQDQVGALVDSLENMGFRRKDMIITDMVKSESKFEEDPDEIIDIKTEREGLGEKEPYTDAFSDRVKYGILVSLEVPEKNAARVMEIMEQNGAVEIIKE